MIAKKEKIRKGRCFAVLVTLTSYKKKNLLAFFIFMFEKEVGEYEENIKIGREVTTYHVKPGRSPLGE